MSYKNESANIIRRSNPEMEKVGAGVYDLVQFSVPVTGAANSTAVEFTAPIGFQLLDAFAVGTATSSDATFTLRTGTTGLTSAMAGAADKALGRTTSIDRRTVKEGDKLNVITNGAADRGVVYIIGRRT